MAHVAVMGQPPVARKWKKPLHEGMSLFFFKGWPVGDRYEEVRKQCSVTVGLETLMN